MRQAVAWWMRQRTCWTGCGSSGPHWAATLTRYAEVVQAGLGEMRGATAPRLLLESGLRATAAALGQ